MPTQNFLMLLLFSVADVEAVESIPQSPVFTLQPLKPKKSSKIENIPSTHQPANHNLCNPDAEEGVDEVWSRF